MCAAWLMASSKALCAVPENVCLMVGLSALRVRKSRCNQNGTGFLRPLYSFQSARTRGARPDSLFSLAIASGVSIRAPAWGATTSGIYIWGAQLGGVLIQESHMTADTRDNIDW